MEPFIARCSKNDAGHDNMSPMTSHRTVQENAKGDGGGQRSILRSFDPSKSRNRPVVKEL